ncbi:hypothetical protein [Paenibacillus rigui]|uniref:Type II secretion system protein GspF domain-containing protein n=1 Tax=Paenibacillus rigui TaxID=554312 RepID=A0A229UGA6_9BACL|nr:hypothetical protein [Paenibacillus rigui]OXM82428.1 hypothetical protein CF651_30920 [Paenibacillus rigui]
MTFYPLLNAAILVLSAWLFSAGLYLALRPLLRFTRELVRTDRRHQSSMKRLAKRSLSNERPNRVLQMWQRWRRELELLLKATQGGRYRDTSLQRFVVLTIATACSVSMVGYFITADVRFSLFAAILTIAAPVLYQRIKLRSLQIQTGYDLAEAVGILSSKYKVTRGNMRLALQLSSQEVGSEPIRRHFMNWIREELNYVDVREMERAVEEFIYGIQTSFAKQLGLTVLKGLLRGENVENTLMAIDKNIHKQIDMLRDEGDSSSEVLQLSWLHVILFPLLMVLMVTFMGYNSTVHYQLETEQGRFWLTTTVCFIVGSLLLAMWFRRPPNDY